MQNNIYTSGEYIRNNPTLDVEDTPWKLTKVIPLVDEFLRDSSLKEIKLLDVGGGAGLILKEISTYLKKMNISVKKNALDLSKEMLQIQKENNPDISTIFEGSIEKTSFANKEIDLVFMIDVLEHVPDAVKALKELSRISKYVIFKVPMENNVYYNILNIVKRGGVRKDIFEKVGHIHFYRFRELEKQIEDYAGNIINCRFTNEFEYMLSKDYHRKLNVKEKIVFPLGSFVFTVSPFLCSLLFPCAVVCLVKCR